MNPSGKNTPNEEWVRKIAELLNSGLGQGRIAETLKIPPATARDYIARIRSGKYAHILGSDRQEPPRSQPAPAPPSKGDPEPTTITEDLQRAALDQKLRDARESEKKYEELLRERIMEQRIVDDFKVINTEAFAKGIIRIEVPDYRPAKSSAIPEDAVLAFGDSHVGKDVDPAQINYVEQYNISEFLKRLAHLEREAVDILTKRLHSKIETLHIMFLGDLIEGALQHVSEIPMRELLVNQCQLAVWALYQFIVHLAAYVPQIKCYGVSGNHGRFPDQKRVPSENTFSNFDWIIMASIESMLDVSRLHNVEFHLDEQIFPQVTIRGWRFKLGHGSHLKGGDRAMGFPAHAIGREINTSTQLGVSAVKQKLRQNSSLPAAELEEAVRNVPDYYVMGDKHRGFVAPTATGSYLINGAWFKADGYSTLSNFPPCRPFQLLFGVQESVGLAWQYNIYLDHVNIVDPPYHFPERLSKLIKRAT